MVEKIFACPCEDKHASLREELERDLSFFEIAARIAEENAQKATLNASSEARKGNFTQAKQYRADAHRYRKNANFSRRKAKEIKIKLKQLS